MYMYILPLKVPPLRSAADRSASWGVGTPPPTFPSLSVSLPPSLPPSLSHPHTHTPTHPPIHPSTHPHTHTHTPAFSLSSAITHTHTPSMARGCECCCGEPSAPRFRGWLVFKAHRLVCHSTLGLRVIKKKTIEPLGGVAGVFPEGGWGCVKKK